MRIRRLSRGAPNSNALEAAVSPRASLVRGSDYGMGSESVFAGWAESVNEVLMLG